MAHEPGWTVSTFVSGLVSPANGLEFDCATNGFYTGEFGAGRVSFVDSAGNASFFASVPSVDEIALNRTSTFLFAKEHSSGPVHMFDTTGTALGTIEGFRSPTGTAFDSAGNFYVADHDALQVFRYDASTLPPNTPIQTPFASGFGSLEGMRFDCQDNLFVTEFLQGNVLQVVPPSGPHITWVSGQSTPINVAFDPCTNNLFVSNLGSSSILRVTSPGVFSLFASGLGGPFALVFDRVGNLYVNEFNTGRIVKFTAPDPCTRNCQCPGGVGCFMVDFELGDEQQALVHGQHLGNGDPEFDGGAAFPVTITSSVNASNGDTAAILDSDIGPAAQDPDLLVGRGNILILQTDVNTNECPPGSDVYCTHNDDEDGGTLSFAFAQPTTPASVVMIDIDSSDGVSRVVLTDNAGATRTYTVPANWTGDLVSDGPPGWGLLDLTTTSDQIGFGSTATASDSPGFDPTDVMTIDVHLGGSGGVDDLSWCFTQPLLASAQLRSGSGVNPSSLSFSSLPVLGRRFTAILDCTSQGSGLAILELRRRPTAGTLSIHGETLIQGALVHRVTLAQPGTVNQLTWDVPDDISLCGLSVYAQGLCLENASIGSRALRVRGRLSNAVDLVLGF